MQVFAITPIANLQAYPPMFWFFSYIVIDYLRLLINKYTVKLRLISTYPRFISTIFVYLLRYRNFHLNAIHHRAYKLFCNCILAYHWKDCCLILNYQAIFYHRCTIDKRIVTNDGIRCYNGFYVS